MDHLYSPWRREYFDRDKARPDCAFCDALTQPDGPANLVLLREEAVFVIMNKFPYTSGHLMVVPYQHVESLEALDAPTQAALLQTASRMVQLLRQVYHPNGFNLGLNLGSAAGAGIAQHLHFHIVPRWSGDANFVTIVGQTRVLPETLEETWLKLKAALA